MHAVADSGLLGDELVPGVDQELEVGVEVRLVHLRQVRLLQCDAGDRDGVALVVLSTASRPPPGLHGEVCGNVDDRLAGGQEGSSQCSPVTLGAFDGNKTRRWLLLHPRH